MHIADGVNVRRHASLLHPSQDLQQHKEVPHAPPGQPIKPLRTGAVPASLPHLFIVLQDYKHVIHTRPAQLMQRVQAVWPCEPLHPLQDLQQYKDVYTRPAQWMQPVQAGVVLPARSIISTMHTLYAWQAQPVLVNQTTTPQHRQPCPSAACSPLTFCAARL
jgi:hypothetical protein